MDRFVIALQICQGLYAPQRNAGILDVSWLNQLDDGIFRHGISLLRWRSGGVKHPHDMPPSRFLPSPTSGDSSSCRGMSECAANMNRSCPLDFSTDWLASGLSEQQFSR